MCVCVLSYILGENLTFSIDIVFKIADCCRFKSIVVQHIHVQFKPQIVPPIFWERVKSELLQHDFKSNFESYFKV